MSALPEGERVEMKVTYFEIWLMKLKLLDLDFRTVKFNAKSLSQRLIGKLFIIIMIMTNIYLIGTSLNQLQADGGKFLRNNIDRSLQLNIAFNAVSTGITVLLHLVVQNETKKLNVSFRIHVLRAQLLIITVTPIQFMVLCMGVLSATDSVIMILQLASEITMLIVYQKAYVLAENHGEIAEIKFTTHLSAYRERSTPGVELL